MKEIVTITSLGSSGEGIGSLNGLKIFIDGALPSEVVEIKIREKKKNYAIGELLKVAASSSQRVDPPCPYFGSCGGCQLMHLSLEGQLTAKRQKVIDALERIGGLEGVDVDLCIPSPNSLHYRNKIQLPLVWDQGKQKIGLFRKNTHEIIPIEKCLIQDPVGEEILQKVRPLLNFSSIRYLLVRTSKATAEALVIFVTRGEEKLAPLAKQILETIPEVKGVIENVNRREDNVILGTTFRTLAGKDFIIEKLGGKIFRLSASAFFQVNPLQAEKLYQTAIEWAEIKEEDCIIDAFCGVGALALFAADYSRKVFGIECVSSAIRDAKENAQLNKAHCSFLCGEAERLFSTLPKPSVVFLNPPRKGCAPSLISHLQKVLPRKIIYISCDPATLARDLKSLVGAGYLLKKVRPFDMFPQTMHVETVAVLDLLQH